MTDKKISDLDKIVAPLPAFIRHQTDAACCVVLLQDTEGEYHIVAEGKGWKAMVVAAAARVLERAQHVTPEEARND
jgi:hypothetical protein